MELRPLGRTGLTVSALGFGCGAVGGLMVRGEPSAQRRAVARAIEAGLRYFDTAPSYGDGRSEENLGRVWHELRPDGCVVGTKFRVEPGEPGAAAALTDLAGTLGLEGPIELSLRLALGKPGVSTVIVGYSDQAQLEEAIRYAERGGLPADAVGGVV